MTNLNTASINDPKSLEGIGNQRATAIINLRDEKGYIPWKTLRKICITLHLQYKNCCTKKISLEIPPELVESIKEW